MTTAVIALAVWAILCVAFLVGEHRWHTQQRARRIGPTYPASVPVPEPRDWYCTDGQWRTEAEAAAWVAETDGSLAEWLAVWPTVEEPLYVPREWVA